MDCCAISAVVDALDTESGQLPFSNIFSPDSKHQATAVPLCGI